MAQSAIICTGWTGEIIRRPGLTWWELTLIFKPSNMKKYSAILLLFSAALVSCKKSFLDKVPHESTDAVFWRTADQAESALAGVYSPLQEEEALGGEEWAGMEAFSD